MTQTEPGMIKLLSPLQDLLLASVGGDTITGAVYGLEVDGTRIVVAAAGQPDQAEKKRELELLNEMIPCGVEPLGVFGVGTSSAELVGLCQQLPALTTTNQPPLLLTVTTEGVEASLCQAGQTELLTVEVISQ